MRTAVIMATYNWPRALELALWGHAMQRTRATRIIVADDGSDERTAEVIARMRGETGLDIAHVWHADQGFRKCEILNRAVAAADEEYLIFTDGDVIPRDDFVATHLEHARPGRYLAGMTIRLPRFISEALTVEDVRSGRATSLRWLWGRGLRPGRHVLRFSRNRAWNTLMDHVTPTPPHMRGCNSSAWRSDVLAANGFEMTMGWGGEDAELGARLVNQGIEPWRVRFRAMTVHLDHDRPWRDAAIERRNLEIRHEVRDTGRTRAVQGLAELTPDDTPAIGA